jgi:hypothetical protein
LTRAGRRGLSVRFLRRRGIRGDFAACRGAPAPASYRSYAAQSIPKYVGAS